MIEQSLSAFFSALGERSPTPGGGAAAAVSAVLGAELLLMVTRFSQGKQGNEEHEGALREAEKSLLQSVELLQPMVQRDCDAFERVAVAYKLPRGTDDEREIRSKAIQEALHGAMVVPEELICMVRDVYAAAVGICPAVNKHIVSDLGAGSAFLRAAADSAFLNVRINAAFLSDAKLVADTHERVANLRSEIDGCRATIEAAVEQMLG